MSNYKIITFVLLLALLFSGPLTTNAQETKIMATLHEFTGEVFVQKKGGKKELPAFEGMQITQGDRIHTSSNASVKLRFAGQNEALLGANTSIYLSDYSANKTVIHLISGELWNNVNEVKELYEVKTATSRMNVQGTQFLVEVNGNQNHSTLSVLDGTVGIGSRIPTIDLEKRIQMNEQVQSNQDLHVNSPSLLHPNELVQRTNPTILVQMIEDQLATIEKREKSALEFEQNYENTHLPEDATAALNEAQRAFLLTLITDAMLTEVQKSPDSSDILHQLLQKRKMSVEELERRNREALARLEAAYQRINQTVEAAGITPDDEEQEVQTVQGKIAYYKNQIPPSPPPAPIIPSPPASGGNVPKIKTISTTFNDGVAFANGTFEGIEYEFFIFDENHDTYSMEFTLHPLAKPFPKEIGRAHGFEIKGLEGRTVQISLRTLDELLSPIAYHLGEDERWTHIPEQTLTINSNGHQVAVASAIPVPQLEATLHSPTSVGLTWGENTVEGILYELYRNGVKILTTSDISFQDLEVEAGSEYAYHVKAIHHGFESEVSPSTTQVIPSGSISGQAIASP